MHAISAIFAEAASPLSFLTELGVEWSRLVSQGLMFILLSVILYKIVFKPVMKTIDERGRTIEKGLADAEASRQKLAQSEREASEKIAAAAMEASELLATTRDNAKAMLERSSQDAAARAADIMKTAKAEIEADRIRMKNELRADIAGLVVKTAEAVLKDAMDDAVRIKIANEAAEKLDRER